MGDLALRLLKKARLATRRWLLIFHVFCCLQIDNVCFLFPSMQLALELLYLYVLTMFIAYLPAFAFSYNQ